MKIFADYATITADLHFCVLNVFYTECNRKFIRRFGFADDAKLDIMYNLDLLRKWFAIIQCKLIVQT